MIAVKVLADLASLEAVTTIFQAVPNLCCVEVGRWEQ